MPTALPAKVPTWTATETAIGLFAMPTEMLKKVLLWTAERNGQWVMALGRRNGQQCTPM